jgi:hypothetical protein
MRAILIDPFEMKITEVDYSGDFEDIYKLIQCGTFDCARIDDHGGTIYIDDEGLINDKPQAFFAHDAYPQPLAGYGLVLGTDDEGDTVAVTYTLDEVKAAVLFVVPVNMNGEIVFLPAGYAS